MFWRIWMHDKATLHEMEMQWSLIDLLDANEALTLQHKWEAEAQARAKAGRDR